MNLIRKVWNSEAMTYATLLFAALALMFVLLGCAESNLQKKIETARLAGDTAEVARLEAELPAAAQQDDTTWGTVGLLGGLFGGPALGGLFASIRSATIRRRAVTAVATAIEAGKKASPEFAELFKGGAAHDAIKSAMPGDVAKIVKDSTAS